LRSTSITVKELEQLIAGGEIAKNLRFVWAFLN